MPQDLPPLAPSSFIVASSGGWRALWEAYSADAHTSDRWEPDEWDKPLTVKDVRALRTFAGTGAVGNGRYIALPNADKLTREVGNALLKLLEEPPPGVFLLLFGETDRMLATIRSRVRTLLIEPGSVSEERLTQFYRQLDPLRQPALTRRFLYYAPLLHSTIQTDLVLDAFQS